MAQASSLPDCADHNSTVDGRQAPRHPPFASDIRGRWCREQAGSTASQAWGARYSPTAIETGTRRIGRNTKPRPTQMVAFTRPLDFRTFAASRMASHD
jgi:hypothetical protein